MKVYSIRTTPHEWTLMRGDTEIGHYTSLGGLLKGAREILLRDKTKSGASLASLCATLERKDAEIKLELEKLVATRTS